MSVTVIISHWKCSMSVMIWQINELGLVLKIPSSNTFNCFKGANNISVSEHISQK